MLSNTEYVNDEEGDGDEWGNHAEVPEDSHSSLELRQMANVYFADRDFDSALPLYSMALEALEAEHDNATNDSHANTNSDANGNGNGNSTDDAYRNEKVIYLCNRAACYYRMQLYEDSKNDAKEAVAVCSNRNAKASFRLAKAQLALHEYKEAVETLHSSIANLASDETQQDQNQQEQEQQVTDLHKLLEIANAYHLQSKNIPNATTLSKIKTLRERPSPSSPLQNYKPTIREFTISAELGEGNYSRVVVVRHSVTNEEFALKMIEKKKCETLAKRQHPNVWNEIDMEKRILGVRLWEDCHTCVGDDNDNDNHGDNEDKKDAKKITPTKWCRRIIKMFHTFQDYNHLYFLMDLCKDGTDMWTTLRYQDKMVGTHPSLAKVHLLELVEALEFIHSRGVVHRDLKCENILLSSRGHLILIDFGTAKDLIQTNLNGPEFVGTPDFMSPEAVDGLSSPDDVAEKIQKGGGGADHTLDLWSLGAVAYQMITGTTPFASPSQYLTYLKIQRGLVCRPMGIADDDAWDFIESLLKVDPKERLGADCFEYLNDNVDDDVRTARFKMKQKRKGYDVIRNHPYFAGCDNTPIGCGNEKEEEETTRPMPSLSDLCIRPIAQLVDDDSKNLDIDDNHPPGDGSCHDMLRLNNVHRGQVMSLLEKLRVLSNPRVYRRFFATKQEARLTKMRATSRDYVGMTQMMDKQFQFPMADSENNDTERSDVVETIFPILYMHVSNPLFIRDVNLNCTVDERKEYMAGLKKSLKTVNKTRPKLVVVSGYLDEACRRILGKVNESINVILNDGASFFAFWCCGGQGLVLRSSDFIGENANEGRNGEQMAWLRQELEQIKMTKHHAYAYVDCDPNQLPAWLLKTLAKSRVLCLFGMSAQPVAIETEIIHYPSADAAGGNGDNEGNDDDDDVSLSSNDSEMVDEEILTMKVFHCGDSSFRTFKIEEYGAWEFQ